jgi:hypothetical protein
MVNEGLNDQVENAMVIYEKILEHHYDNSTPQEAELKELIHFFEQSHESYKAAYVDGDKFDSYITVHQWNAIYSGIPYFFQSSQLNPLIKKIFSYLTEQLIRLDT